MRLVLDPNTSIAVGFTFMDGFGGGESDRHVIVTYTDKSITVRYRENFESEPIVLMEKLFGANPSMKIRTVAVMPFTKETVMHPVATVDNNEPNAFVWLKQTIAKILGMNNIDEALTTTSFIDDLGFDENHWEDLEQECVERYGEEFVDLQAWPTEYKTLQDLLNVIEHIQPSEEDLLDDDGDDGDDLDEDDSDEDEDVDLGPELPVVRNEKTPQMVQKVITQVLGDAEKVELSKRIVEDLGADDFAISVEIRIGLEEEFGFEIADDEPAFIKASRGTVADLCEFIDKHRPEEEEDEIEDGWSRTRIDAALRKILTDHVKVKPEVFTNPDKYRDAMFSLPDVNANETIVAMVETFGFAISRGRLIDGIKAFPHLVDKIEDMCAENDKLSLGGQYVHQTRVNYPGS